MKKKKLLVCGSAGYMMSNFVRYLIYMTRDTKEFEIVSIDKLKNIKDYKRLYIHKDHKFYIGDITDEYFLDRLLFVENPDYIINGCFYNNQQPNGFDEMIKGTSNLLRAKAPLIQICGCTDPSYDHWGFWKFLGEMIIHSKKQGSVIEIPNSFGFRQRNQPWFSVPWILHELVKRKSVDVRDTKVPWVFAEDIASLIWYVIENNIKGHVKMPALGWLSESEIAEFIKNVYNLPFEINVHKPEMELEYMVTKYEAPIINGWKPDSANVYSSLERTIKWFDANRWAFDL